LRKVANSQTLTNRQTTTATYPPWRR